MRILQGATSKKEQCLLGASAVRQSAVIALIAAIHCACLQPWSRHSCLQFNKLFVVIARRDFVKRPQPIPGPALPDGELSCRPAGVHNVAGLIPISPIFMVRL